MWLKVAFTVFMAVLIPVYWVNYGPANFVYPCDAALLLTLFSIWTDTALPVSMAAVGILVPQFLWCVDFGAELLGFHLTGMTRYMFDENRSLVLRGLSLFHGWFPFLLVYLVFRLEYERRALLAWTGLAVVPCLIACFLIAPAGAELVDPRHPRNVYYVFGMDDARPQAWLPQPLYLCGWIVALVILTCLPAHLVLRRISQPQGTRNGS